jgi:malonyl-CoA decarboxylase
MAGLLMADTENPDLVKAAIFYSITSTQRGLQGIELGNYLIKRVVKELRAEFPLVHQFSSLSPIPQFRSWLLDRLKVSQLHQLFTPEEAELLTNHMGIKADAANVRTLLSTNDWLTDLAFVVAMQEPLMRLCARYLFVEKRRGFALDSVGEFKKIEQ